MRILKNRSSEHAYQTTYIHTYLMKMGLSALATRGLALAWNFNLLPSRCENYQHVTCITY